MVARCASSCLAAAVFLVLVGCQPKAPPKGPDLPPGATAEDVTRIRADLLRANPRTQVGIVTAVLPDASLAAVSDVDMGAFRQGNIVVFIDIHQRPFAGGQVVRITADSLHVRYQAASGGRAPREGDLAVATFPQ